MSESKDSKKPKRADPWAALQRYPTPRGIAVHVDDLPAYLRALAPNVTDDPVAKLAREGIDVKDVLLYRIFLRGRADRRKFAAAIRDLTKDGERMCVCGNRLSGSENQRDGASGPGQEYDNVMQALRLGSKRILVVCEAFSAAAGSERAVFPLLLQALRERLVRAWIAAQIERITRAPGDAVAFVEAVQESSTEIYSPSHKGPVDPYQALMMMLMLILGSLQVISIRTGNARGWRRRVDDGEWPNTGQLLPGMRVDEDKRPYMTDKAREAVPHLYKLIAGGATLEEALRTVEDLYPRWWLGGSDLERPPSKPRALRLLRSPALVDGKQTFSFGEENREAQFPGMKSIVAREVFDRVQQLLMPDPRNPRSKSSAWERCFTELTQELSHPAHALVEDSDGALGYDADGNIRPICRHCLRKGVEPMPRVTETDAFYTELALADGRSVRNYPVPVFACEECKRTTRPISTRVLEQLLAGHMPLCCPRCRTTRVHVRTDSVVDRERMVQIRCDRCRIEYLLPRSCLTVEDRFRFFVQQVKLPRERPRHEIDLRAFDGNDTDDFDDMGKPT